MEGLQAAIKDEIDASLYHPLRIGNASNECDLSISFYADDIIFLGEWRESNLDCLIDILAFFFTISRLKLNPHKLSLYGVGVPSAIVEQAASQLGCMAATLPFVHLGLRIGRSMNKAKSWDPIVEKAKKTSRFFEV
ncbi:uncharacterized protein [Rutidosis leptorrhynchoides]|uniref:uncharacterized protein n=1 Tax=Rutidosis leptorrhynchoides TaxID=125765 RepID=UPI003A98D0D0